MDADIRAAVTLLGRHGFRVLSSMPKAIEPRSSGTEERKSAVFVDVETTGLDHKRHEVIELGMVPFTYSAQSGEVLATFAPFHAYNDPKHSEITPEITRLTGITPEMVKGKSFDVDAIEAFISPFNLVVAHHAAFDRPFCEDIAKVFEDMYWACSMEQVPWKQAGINSAALEFIAFKLGWHYEGHNSIADCMAGINVLSALVQPLGGTALKTMLLNARKSTSRIWAVASHFDFKDLLKDRGYKWNDGVDGRPKAWWRDVPEEETDSEMSWLSEFVYKRPRHPAYAAAITARNRFTERA